MAARTAENVANVQVRGTLAGQLIETGLYYLFDAAIDNSALAALAASVSSSVVSHWLDELPTDFTLRNVYAYDMTAGSTLQVTDTFGTGDTGHVSGGAAPNNASIAIARKTGKRGRSTQGRIFWPALAISMLVDPLHVTTTDVTAIVAALTATDTDATALGWSPVTLSFQHAGVKTTAAVVTLLNEWLAVDNAVDSQRRRLAGRGT